MIEEEHRRVRQVRGQDPVQLVGAADAGTCGRLLCALMSRKVTTLPAPDASGTGEDEATTGSTDPSLRRKRRRRPGPSPGNPADQLAGLVAEHGQPGRVHVDDRAVVIGDQQPIGDAVGDGPGEAGRLRVLDLGRPAVGDVLRHEVQDPVLGHARPVDQPVVAVAGAVSVLEGDGRRRLPGSGILVATSQRHRDIVGMHEREKRLGHQLARATTPRSGSRRD